jgi:uncharacterized protein
MPRDENFRDVDAFALAKQGRALAGEVALVRLARLVEGLPEQQGRVHWDVQGSIGQGTSRTGVWIGGQSLLHLHVRADLTLECQRCGALFTHPVDSHTVLQLVESEEDLDEEFAEPNEEDEENFAVADHPDKVVGSRHFDLLAQVEDELILSVPYVPRHEVCPGAQASAGEASEPARRPSPFAVLGQLKRKDAKDVNE